MKKLLVLALAICLMIPVFSTAEDAPAGDIPVEVTSDLTILRQNVMVTESWLGKNVFLLGEVRNDGESPVYLSYDGCNMVVLDADGNQIGDAGFFGPSTYPNVIGPGETAFLHISVSVDGEPASAVLTLAVSESWSNGPQRVDAAGEYFPPEGYSANGIIRVTVANTGDAAIVEPYAAAALTDADGNIIGIGYTSVYDAEIPAGSSLVLKLSVDEAILAWWAAKGVEPAGVETIVWVK